MYSSPAASSIAQSQMGHVLNMSPSSVSDKQRIESYLSNRPIPTSQKTLLHRTPSELAEMFEVHKLAKKSKKKGIRQEQAAIELINSMHMFDDLNELDAESAIQIGNSLLYYPVNAKKQPEFTGLSGYDVITKNLSLAEPKECLARSTVIKVVRAYSSFLKWCQRLGYVQHNHFWGISSDISEGKKTPIRQPFNDDELSLIFNMDDYRNCRFLHPYYYWIPLLLRFTGARLNELCQLYRSDVKIIDGIQCLSISETYGDQTVKSVSATRNIPIHSALLKRGFWEFAKSGTSMRIFPELKLVDEYYSNNASKWFKRRRDKLGLGRGKDAHSFRHTFSNELKQKEVSSVMITDIIGHEQDSITMRVYCQHFRPSVLQPHIEKLDTSHVAHIPPYSFK